ncbi:nucleoside monophosphate kinase [Patescibacteria group bacterium]|nr:nucleoside monophosphate kinase [Patescibacteria group bacterium]MBU2035950.1 nucleoside monophosphate kinase [Patescibacteria group bacterium]
MNILIFGPQASGKGTQAHILAGKLGLFYLSTGDLFRKLSEKDSKVKRVVEKGELPSDELAFSLLKRFIKDEHGSYQNIIFDGFPRNVNQYLMLKRWFYKNKSKIDYAILLDISDEEAIRRLSARRVCSDCKEIFNLITNPSKNPKVCDKCGGELVQREDDKPEAIEKRLSLYRNVTKPLIDVFEKEGVLKKVNGEQPIEDISRELLSFFGKQ